MTSTAKNYAGQNLRGRSFKGEDLLGADFSGADLRGTNFTGAIEISTLIKLLSAAKMQICTRIQTNKNEN